MSKSDKTKYQELLSGPILKFTPQATYDFDKNSKKAFLINGCGIDPGNLVIFDSSNLICYFIKMI